MWIPSQAADGGLGFGGGTGCGRIDPTPHAVISILRFLVDYLVPMEGKEGKKTNKKKLRITLVRNVRRTDSRVVLLLQDGSLLHQARQAASDKLRIPHSQVSKPLID